MHLTWRELVVCQRCSRRIKSPVHRPDLVQWCAEGSKGRGRGPKPRRRAPQALREQNQSAAGGDGRDGQAQEKRPPPGAPLFPACSALLQHCTLDAVCGMILWPTCCWKVDAAAGSYLALLLATSQYKNAVALPHAKISNLFCNSASQVGDNPPIEVLKVSIAAATHSGRLQSSWCSRTDGLW